MTTLIAELTRTAANDLPRATRMAAEAKAGGVSDPLVHHLLALELQQAGRYEEAIAELGLGLQLAPDDSRLMITVGFCLMELGRRQEAAKVFGVAMKLDPASAEASYGYGWAAERLGALEAAASGFKRAVALDPGHADALAGLSGLAVRRRAWDEARVLAERAAALSSRQTDALMNLARVEIGQSNFDAAERRLTEIIGLAELKPAARANARIMLGDALDGAGRYAEAYDAYAQGKAELDAIHAEQFAGQDASPVGEVVRSQLAEFLETPAAAWAAPAPPGPTGAERGHAFLVGFPRSGTTLMEQVLATHPDVAPLGERPVMIDAEVEFLTRAGGIRRLADTLGDLLEPYRTSYWKRVREFGVDAAGKVFVDKHPLSTIRLPLIHKVFPGAKIIFAMRDPRDVVLSCFRRSFNMNPSTYAFNTIEGAAAYYDAVMTAGAAYLERLPVEVLKVRYEDVVGNFDSSAHGLCDFLGVPWTDDLRDFAATAADRMIATPSSTQVGRGLYEGGADQWRNYEFALKPVLPILAPWIERFGYPAT